MIDLHSTLTVAVAALVTMALRFLPFLIFGENRKTPPIITYLGQVLPYAIMGMLVVYCLKDIPSPLPPLASRNCWAAPQSLRCTSGNAAHC